MQTSARPRTLVLVVSDIVVDIAMLGPQGRELGERQVVPITTETATMWNAIGQLGEFDRITVVGADRGALCQRIAQQSGRPLRQMSHGSLYWNGVITRAGVELAISLAPRFSATLFHEGVEVPGCDAGRQLVRKDRRLREYLAPRAFERKGADAWLKRVTRAVDEILAVWNPTRLFLAAPSELPMPELPDQVILVPERAVLDDALRVWDERASRSSAV